MSVLSTVRSAFIRLTTAYHSRLVATDPEEGMTTAEYAVGTTIWRVMDSCRSEG